MTELKIDKDTVRECRFAVFCPPPDGSRDDMHMVKEVVHIDGKIVPHVVMRKNFKRPYWVTAPNWRNHKQKKETELADRLMKYTCTQSELNASIVRTLDLHWMDQRSKDNLRKLCRNPYIYGADIKSTAILKRQYQDRWPNTNTPHSVACSDTETDVLHGHGEILIQSITMKNKVYTAIQNKFVEGRAMVIPRLREMLQKYLGEYVEARKIEWEVELVDSEAEVVIRTVNKAHEWKPDFFAMWNIDFDIPKMIKALERAGIDPKDVFSDPIVPREYRFFEYAPGPTTKKTSSGKVIPKKPEERWNTVYTPASFYVIDPMCAYKQIRISDPSQPSYSLDYTLGNELNLGKLRFKEADHVGHGLAWHILMQREYPLEYVIYNIFDCISMELLDEKTKDLSVNFPMLCGSSDYVDFKSQPRRLVNELHFFVQKETPARVFGTTSDEMAADIDDLTVTADDWIIMLPAHLVADNGLRAIMENPDLPTNLRRDVADLDVAASYPNGGACFNIARNTTAKELIEINGVDDFTRRMQGINLSAGHVNAVEICISLFGMPTLTDWADAFSQHQVNQFLDGSHENTVPGDRGTQTRS